VDSDPCSATVRQVKASHCYYGIAKVHRSSSAIVPNQETPASYRAAGRARSSAVLTI
jgi:hypothetical protein